MRRPVPLMLFSALAFLALDQLTKWLVVEAMALKTRLAIDLVPGALSFRMAWNRGVNFGIFAQESPQAQQALAGLAAAISFAVALWVWRHGGAWRALAAGALIGGALGNAWDRLTYGAVADFLNVTCCALRNPYAFNVADIAIFAGAVALALLPARG